MSLRVFCPACGKALRVPDHLTGKAVGCPSCRARIPVATPLPDDPDEPPPPPPARPRRYGPPTWLLALAGLALLPTLSFFRPIVGYRAFLVLVGAGFGVAVLAAVTPRMVRLA